MMRAAVLTESGAWFGDDGSERVRQWRESTRGIPVVGPSYGVDGREELCDLMAQVAVGEVHFEVEHV